jgi:heme A synthase
VLFWFGTLAFRTGGTLQRLGAGLMGLVAAQLALGAAVVSFDLPRVVVLGHNLVASLLLLCLIRMRLLVQPQEPA